MVYDVHMSVCMAVHEGVRGCISVCVVVNECMYYVVVHESMYVIVHKWVCGNTCVYTCVVCARGVEGRCKVDVGNHISSSVLLPPYSVWQGLPATARAHLV